MSSINERLTQLRECMKKGGISAVIIPSSDPHQSEYPADRWKSREWISGFTGSAGVAVVTMEHAGLWTDARYFQIAEDELSGSEFELHKLRNQFDSEEIQWIKDNLPSGSKVGIDGYCFSIGQLNAHTKTLSDKGITIVDNIDYFSTIWLDRPSLPSEPVYAHDIKFAGKDRATKIAEVRATMDEVGANYHLITTLDDIGWLLNLRGSDVTYNPVFIAYVLIEKDKVKVFTSPDKFTSELNITLASENIDVVPYSTINEYLSNIAEDAVLLMDKSTCNCVLFKALKCSIVDSAMPSRRLKALKNEVEIEHTRQAMVQDGIALAKSFYWLEHTLEERTVSEVEFAGKLAEMRSQQDNYVGESFGAIVGYKSNGAIMHYRPEAGKCADIKMEGMLLVDSGGQYLNGTTDITRTFHLSEPTDEQIRHNTLVLKGMIELTKAKFPVGTSGRQLDTLARMHLWRHGLDFGHGTGHGVGFFMNVHEPPQGFSPTASLRGNTIHEPGMITSNEPGYYLEGAYGIRIENLVLTVEADEEGFLEHETLTLYPFEQNLIDETIMTSREKAWFNRYHHKCYEKIAPALTKEEQEWFKQKCKPLN